MRRKLSGVIAAGLLLAALGGPSVAQAAPVELSLAWDNRPNALSWHPGTAVTAMGSFVGAPIAVPGDAAHRSLLVRNDGPTAALATVQLRDLQVINPPGCLNHNLADLIHVVLDVGGQKIDTTAAHVLLDGGLSAPVQLAVNQGGLFTVTAGYYFPAGATSGRNAGQASQVIEFNLVVTLTQDPKASEGVAIHSGGVSLPIHLWTRWLPIVCACGTGVMLALWRRRPGEAEAVQG